ncbi:MAG: aspartyl-phosphate phosphatase Spo0E family protein [Halanaerobiaceae bacterium]
MAYNENKLVKNIEKLRRELISTGTKNNQLTNKKIVKKSHELDNLLNKYNKLIYSER